MDANIHKHISIAAIGGAIGVSPEPASRTHWERDGKDSHLRAAMIHAQGRVIPRSEGGAAAR